MPEVTLSRKTYETTNKSSVTCTERERFTIKLTSARRHTLHVIRSMHLQSDSIRLSFILRAILIARIDTEVKVCRHLWLYPSKQVCGLNTSTIWRTFAISSILRDLIKAVSRPRSVALSRSPTL